MPIDKTKLSQEMLRQAAMCETADELIAMAKVGGFEITKDEAEAFMAELEDLELDAAELEKVAGGIETCYMVDGCGNKCGLFH